MGNLMQSHFMDDHEIYEDELLDEVDHIDPVDRAFVLFQEAGFEPGDVIPTSWFTAAFKVPPAITFLEQDRNRMYYADCMGRLRYRLLTELNRALRTRSGFGQVVVRPNEQTAWAMQRLGSGVRRELNKAYNRVANVDRTYLSAQERAENHNALAKLSFFNRTSMPTLEWSPKTVTTEVIE